MTHASNQDIDRAPCQTLAGSREKQCGWFRVAPGDFSLPQPLRHSVTGGRIQRNFPIAVAFALADNHPPLAVGHGDVVHIEGHAFTNPQSGVEEQDRNGPIPGGRLAIRGPEKAFLFLRREGPWGLLGERFAGDVGGPELLKVLIKRSNAAKATFTEAG